MSVIKVNANNFEAEVLKSDQTVLVDFFATWCGPCKMLSPVVDEFAEDHPEVKVAKLDIDEVQEIAIKYGVMSVPTLAVFKNGEVVKNAVGVQSIEKIEDMVQ